MATTATYTALAPVQRMGRIRHGYFSYTLSGTYSAAGGFAVSASSFGLTRILAIQFHGPAWLSTAAVVPVYDSTNGKIVVYIGDNNNTNDAPLVEGNVVAPDLTSYVGTLTVIGY